LAHQDENQPVPGRCAVPNTQSLALAPLPGRAGSLDGLSGPVLIFLPLTALVWFLLGRTRYCQARHRLCLIAGSATVRMTGYRPGMERASL
jgi:hypothetical protein